METQEKREVSSSTPGTTNQELKETAARTSTATTGTVVDHHPSPSNSGLPQLHFSFRCTVVVTYIVFLVICNVLIPCLLFYLLKIYTTKSDQTLIGISSAALGISSCFDAPFRLFKLLRYRRQYGPLNDDVWWHLDFFMWLYAGATLVFAIPLAIAPAIPLYNFFLMSTAMLVCPVGIVFLLSLLSFRLPVWCSSDPPGTPTKPAVFYTIEDVAAVDFKHGRDFRAAIHARWHASPPFRRINYILTLYWGLAMLLFVGITAAVTWASRLGFAFGWVLGQFFLWAGVSSLGSWALARWGLAKEKQWWNNQDHDTDELEKGRS